MEGHQESQVWKRRVVGLIGGTKWNMSDPVSGPSACGIVANDNLRDSAKKILGGGLLPI